MNALRVNIQQKTYPNGFCAIKDLTFSAQAGEFIAIVGPSGSGKTTLLNLISGLDKTMQGSIGFYADSAPHAPPTLTQPNIGFMFQDPRLMPWLTVAQNLELVLPPQMRAQQAAQLEQWLALVGLPDCGPLFPGQLSGGMQRRVALLRAFIVKPDVLLMDEPFQSLDAPTAQQLRALLKDLCQRTNPTVLFVTHSLREALRLANRIVFLSASPSCVILDFRLDLQQQQNNEEAWVQSTHASLLAQYPRLLNGAID